MIGHRLKGLRVDRASDGVYYLTGELDAASGAGLESDVGPRALDDEDLTLDLRDLTTWDVSGIRAILRIADRPDPRRVVLLGSPPNLVGWLNVLGLGRFRVRKDNGMSGWVLEATGSVREGLTDGPGAWSRWAAFRAMHDSALVAHRELANRVVALVARSVETCESAASLRRDARASRLAFAVTPPRGA